MADKAYAWCQDCQRWVPAEKMNYFDGRRVCQWCMEGTKSLKEYVYEPNHERTQCVFCDSYNTIEQKPNWGVFRCNDCGEIFKGGIY